MRAVMIGYPMYTAEYVCSTRLNSPHSSHKRQPIPRLLKSKLIIKTIHIRFLIKPTNMLATTTYSSNVKIIINRLNPFKPGITNVNDIPEKNRIVEMANIKNVLGNSSTIL